MTPSNLCCLLYPYIMCVECDFRSCLECTSQGIIAAMEEHNPTCPVNMYIWSIDDGAWIMFIYDQS